MLKVPKLSAPLKAGIRTTETILVFLVNIGLVVGAAIDPSKLSPQAAGILAAALTGLHVASRTLLKVVAVQQGVGIAPPAPFDPAAAAEAELIASKVVPQVVEDVAGKTPLTAAQVEQQLVSDAEEFASPPPPDAPVAPVPPVPPPAA
jgi:hypothetical protein